jgi:hypothetical protein
LPGNTLYLSLAEIHAVLTYYFDHVQEIEDELIAEYSEVDEWKKAHPTARLLVRLKQFPL